MVNTIVSIPGYVHLYRSLLRFYDMPENEIREMLYLLNTANLDCYGYYHPERELVESGPGSLLPLAGDDGLPALPHGGTALQVSAVPTAQCGPEPDRDLPAGGIADA